MPITLTPEQTVAELRALGHDPRDVVVLKGGMWSAAFGFRERDRDYVVRFHERRDDLEKDRFAQRWSSARLRMPKIVEIGDFRTGAYGISERVHGQPIDDLDEAGMRQALPSLFAGLDALRGADMSDTSGYGLWHGEGRAAHRSWADALLLAGTSGTATSRDLLVRAGIGVAEYDAGIARMRSLIGFAPAERHVVHNDLLYNNVLRDEAGLVFLDWGASIFGDFLYDAALLTFWWPWYRAKWGGIDVRAELLSHYREIGLEIPHVLERLRLCELDIGVSHIPFQVEYRDHDNARWTAARTAELARAAIES